MATGSKLFLDGIESLRGLSKGTKTFLENSNVESTLAKVLNKDGKLTAEVVATSRIEFRNFYADYLRRAAEDQKALVKEGLIREAKSSDTLRNEFFDQTLGHLPRKDRDLLRIALSTRAPEVVTAPVVLKDGTKVTRQEYTDLAKQPKGAIDLGATGNKRDMVHERESGLAQAREAARTERRASSKTHAEELAATRNADQTAAREASEKLARETAQTAAATTTTSTNIGQAASRLESVYRTTGAIDHATFFPALRSQLADPNLGLLKRNLADINPSDMGNRPREVLQRSLKGEPIRYGDPIEYKAPKDILQAIKDRRPVTETELNRLETFFMNPAYDASKAGSALNNIPPLPAYVPGAAIPATLINGAKAVIQSASKDGDVARKVPTALRTLFETGEDAGFVKRAVAAVTENRLLRNGVGAAAMATAVAVPAVATLTSALDPEDYGQTGTALFNAAHLEMLSSAEIKDKTKSEITLYLYTRLTSGEGLSNPDLQKYTKDITGIELDKELKDVHPQDPKYRDVFFKVASALQNVTAVPGYNGDAMSAYRFAIAKHMGMATDKLTDDISAIADFARGQVVESYANAMNSNENVKLREETLMKFYGKTNLTSDEYVQGFVNYQPKPGDDPLLKLKIGKFLIKQNVLTDGDITEAGIQTLKKTLTEVKAGQETATRDLTQTTAQANIEGLMRDIGEANAGGVSTRVESPAADSKPALKSADKMKEILGNTAEITGIAPDALEKALGKASRSGRFDRDVMENELAKVDPAQARRAAAWVNSGLSEPSPRP